LASRPRQLPEFLLTLPQTERLKKITAQLVMIVVAATVGWAMRRGIGRKTIFLVAFVTLPIRGFLFMLTDSPLGVVAIQLLDGVTAGIFGVISIIIAADLMRGTGRFNLAQAREFVGIGKAGGRGLPTVLIPTTAGTGAEATFRRRPYRPGHGEQSARGGSLHPHCGPGAYGWPAGPGHGGRGH
jgi:MFS family permease